MIKEVRIMADPFLGEIRIFGGNFAPLGWAFCNGAILAIAQNDALFSLIGTTYGGDGQSTFALPDLQGRVPIHQGTGAGLSPRIMGDKGGVEAVILTVNQIPGHTHSIPCSQAAGSKRTPIGGWPAADATAVTTLYAAGPANAVMHPQAVGSAGGSQPHENRMPFLAVSYIISLFGIFPSQA
jgi:microcystin-dependent protein